MSARTLLFASHNAGKLRELRALLPGHQIIGLSELSPPPEPVEESAPDLSGNAALKALAGAALTGHLCLADDSGLEVDALDGAPGVRSARYAPGSDSDRNQALLRALDGIPEGPERGARFRCVLALADPLRAPTRSEEELPPGIRRGERCDFAEGTLEGEIALTSRGAGGFGYDPLFKLPDGRRLAELSGDEKNQISHRGRALEQIRPLLLRALKATP